MIHVEFLVPHWYQIQPFTMMPRVVEKSRALWHGSPVQVTCPLRLILLTLPFESQSHPFNRSHICFSHPFSVTIYQLYKYSLYNYIYIYSSVIVEKIFFFEVFFSFIFMILYISDTPVLTQDCAYLISPLSCSPFSTVLNV